MTFRELPTITPEEFDAFALHPLQTFAWGTIRQTTGLRVVRFGAFEGDSMVAVYEMTLHKVPLVPYFIGYVPRSQMPSEEFLQYLKSYCKTYKIISVLFEPCEKAGEVSIPAALRRSSTPLFYTYSRVINTTLPIETIKEQLEAQTRYNIGLAERKGVVVSTEDSEKGFEAFYTLYEGTTKRQHFGGHTHTYHKTIWDTFHARGIAHILVARLGTTPLAACEVWFYKETLYYTYAGSSMEERNKKPMNALLWGVILFAKEHGAQHIDLWGTLPEGAEMDTSNPWAGFSDFKKGYGGKVIEMIGSYDLIVNPVFYFLYVFAAKVRKTVARFR